MSDFSSNRLLGLDIARSIAILTVVAAHARYLMDSPGHYDFMGLSGKIGVELFFVLSGFLIGSILLRGFTEELSWQRLIRFWLRRWFRTIPAYFGVLVFIWVVFGEVSPVYFLFLQDLVLHSWDILPVSWSLVIEEWFYLIFGPLCLVLMSFSLRWGFFLASVLLLVSGVVFLAGDYGACVASEQPLKCFENDIRKFTFRFTSLGMGTLLAWLHFYHNLEDLFKGWRKAALLIVTPVVVAGMFWFCGAVLLDYPGLVPAWWGFMLFYPLMGIASLLVIMVLYTMPPSMPRWAVSFITFVSLTSYSNYLWHLMVNEGLRGVDLNQYLLVLFFVLGSFAVSALSYLALEKPFLQLRDRLAP